jgi:hypothetical protein
VQLYPKLIERVLEHAAMTEEVEHEHRVVKTALGDASTQAYYFPAAHRL